MIYIDDTDPEGVLEPAFPPRDVTISRGVNAKELYEVIGEIGRGKFGTVYKCREKATGLTLAAKFVPIPKRDDRRNVEREVELMNSLQHHLIIQLYGAYEYQKMMCVVLEIVEGGELFDRVIEDEFVLSERVCTVFIRQVCEAMEFIHRNNILHLDLKPENILCLTKEGNRIKIIDFGLARKYDPDKKLQILFGTPEFVAPEVVNFDCITYGTDMWSVGVICYVLLSGLSPFMGETDIQTMANVTIAKYDFDDEAFNNVSPEALDFISKLLVKDCSIRLTATQALGHKWLQRRPKEAPVISPKPVAVAAAPPVVTPTAKPAVAQLDENENETKELEITKDNLKNFIERWEEHPNSPYVFDVDANVIVPLTDSRGNSISSSRVCSSPSPCESIASLPDDEVFLNNNNGKDEILKPLPIVKPKSAGIIGSEKTMNAQANSNNGRNFKDYLHSFDRRNSDTNYLLGRRPSGEKMNLAEEIRKLSDHLMMLAEINTKLGTDDQPNDDAAKSLPNVAPNDIASKTTKGGKSKVDSNGKSKPTEKRTNKVETNEKTKTTTPTKVKSFKTPNKEISSVIQPTSTAAATRKISSLSVRLQQSIEETPKLSTTSTTQSTTTTAAERRNGFKSSASSIFSTTVTTSASSSIPYPSDASMKRMKFRVNQMSRDVPVGSPNTHQTVNLEEAANTTKDCLLHLLEKYNDTTKRNPVGRHSSISVDWNMSDNLEYRTMSSINAFFQRHSTTGRNVRSLQAQLEGKSPTNNGGAT